MKTFVVVGGSNDICFLSAPSHEGIKVKQSKSIFRKTKLAQLMVKANCECKIWHKISQVRIFWEIQEMLKFSFLCLFPHVSTLYHLRKKIRNVHYGCWRT